MECEAGATVQKHGSNHPSQDRLKVALISTSYAPWLLGGAERSIKELCEDLTSSGHSVRVLVLGPKSRGTTFETVDGVEVVRYGSNAFAPFEHGGENRTVLSKVRFHAGELARIGTYRFIMAELANFKPDVVHLNNIAGLGWIAWLATRNYPTVQTLRDYYLCCLNNTGSHKGVCCQRALTPCAFARAPFRILKFRPTLFAAVSDRTLDIHRMRGALKASDNAITVYNQPSLGIERAAIHRVDERTAGLTFGMLGRIGRDKGTWLALEAFRRASSVVGARAIRLVIAGSGSAQEEILLKNYVAENPQVTFIGTTTPASFFQRVDVALVPTQWEEPFGRSAAEALQAGIALIASRVGGLSEVTKLYGGRFALIDDYRNPNAWRDAIVEVTKNLPTNRPAEIATESSTTQQYLDAYRSAITHYDGVALENNASRRQW